MKTYGYIKSATFEFSFDPGMKMRVYVETTHNSRDIIAHLIDKTGMIIRIVSPEVWNSPERIISDISRNDLFSMEEWANKIIEAVQRDCGWLISA